MFARTLMNAQQCVCRDQNTATPISIENEASHRQHWTPRLPGLRHFFLQIIYLFFCFFCSSCGPPREFNRYWWFGGDPSVFIHAEEKGGGLWGQYKSQKEADALRDSQHPRGKRGALLRRNLCQVFYLSCCSPCMYCLLEQ